MPENKASGKKDPHQDLLFADGVALVAHSATIGRNGGQVLIDVIGD